MSNKTARNIAAMATGTTGKIYGVKSNGTSPYKIIAPIAIEGYTSPEGGSPCYNYPDFKIMPGDMVFGTIRNTFSDSQIPNQKAWLYVTITFPNSCEGSFSKEFQLPPDAATTILDTAVSFVNDTGIGAATEVETARIKTESNASLTSAILTPIGLLTGLGYAFYKKSTLWGYIGWGILFMVIGRTTGTLADTTIKVMKKQ